MLNDIGAVPVRYSAPSGYVLREIAGEFLLIPVEMRENIEDQIAVMNETGKFLWERLTEGGTEEMFLQAMMEEYQVSREEALADIIEFLNDLKKYKLLQESRGE